VNAARAILLKKGPKRRHTMALQANGRAPYTSAAAAITAVDVYRERGLGTPVTADVLIRAGVPESIARRTLASLQELELVGEDGRPTPTFDAFRQTRGEDEYRARVQEWLRDVYADVLQYADPSQDSIERVQEAFRGYEPEGQRKAMASLFVGLWQYAGLPVIAGETPTRRPHRSNTPTRRQGPQRQAPQRKTATHVTDLGMKEGLPPGLVGLLGEIPRLGGTWTTERRNSFLRAFEAILDFTVQVDDSPESGVSEQEASP
jgi:hypothetical protein